MSYILDALRKADAERERDAASNLLGPPQPDRAGRPADTPARRLPIWLWLGVGATMPLAALLAWRWAAPPEAAPVVATATPLPISGDEVRAVAPASAPLLAAASAPEAVAAAATDIGSAAAASADAASAPPHAAKAKPPRKPGPPRPPTPTPTPAEVRPAAPPHSVRALAELPEDLRRQVPQMAIGGSVYSPQPASRMLVVNGQVVREGATLAPGLQLESIGRQSAVFSIRGQRFSMPL